MRCDCGSAELSLRCINSSCCMYLVCMWFMLLNGALWDICLMHCGICEIGSWQSNRQTGYKVWHGQDCVEVFPLYYVSFGFKIYSQKFWCLRGTKLTSPGGLLISPNCKIAPMILPEKWDVIFHLKHPFWFSHPGMEIQLNFPGPKMYISVLPIHPVLQLAARLVSSVMTPLLSFPATGHKQSQPSSPNDPPVSSL